MRALRHSSPQAGTRFMAYVLIGLLKIIHDIKSNLQSLDVNNVAYQENDLLL
jgi:hypothetical protein